MRKRESSRLKMKIKGGIILYINLKRSLLDYRSIKEIPADQSLNADLQEIA